MKLVVVPESSDRWMIAIAVSGSSTPSLSAAIASSFHFVMVPLKTLAMVSAVMFSVSTPSTLKATAIGLTYAGTSIGSLPQVSAAALSSPSSSFMYESLPANTYAPLLKFSRPVPEPTSS